MFITLPNKSIEKTKSLLGFSGLRHCADLFGHWLRNFNYLPLAAFVGADAVEDSIGFEDGEVTLHAFGGYADFFRESADGMLRIFSPYFKKRGYNIFTYLLKLEGKDDKLKQLKFECA